MPLFQVEDLQIRELFYPSPSSILLLQLNGHPASPLPLPLPSSPPPSPPLPLSPQVWPILTGCFPPDSTAAERSALQASKAAEYRVLLSQWQSISEQQAKRFSKYRERCSRIDKDVVGGLSRETVSVEGSIGGRE